MMNDPSALPLFDLTAPFRCRRPRPRDGRSVHFRFGQEVDKIEKRAGGLEVDIRKGPEGSSVVKRYQAYQVIEAMGYQVRQAMDMLMQANFDIMADHHSRSFLRMRHFCRVVTNSTFFRVFLRRTILAMSNCSRFVVWETPPASKVLLHTWSLNARRYFAGGMGCAARESGVG